MTRIFTDGAEYGDLLFFDAITGGPAIVATPRSGVYAYRTPGSTSLAKNITPLSEFYFRAAWRCVSSNPTINFRSSPGAVTELQLYRDSATGLLRVYRGSGATLLATGIHAMANGTYYLVEAYIKLDNVNGIVTVKIDGAADSAYAGDTITTNATIDQIHQNSGVGVEFYTDDWALNDTSNADGLNDNSWCGDGKVELLVPNGNGYISQWVGQDGDSVNNYLNVDEVPSDGDTTYNQDGTAANKDACTITDWAGANKIALRLWVEGRIKDTVAAGNNVKLGVRAGGANYMSGNLPLLTSYTRIVGTGYKTDPSDAAAWTDADIDGLEAVIETV